MPNLNKVLGDEIRRLARKETSQQVGDLKKTVAASRKDVAALKKQVAQQERQIKQLVRQAGKSVALAAKAATEAGAPLPRFSPAWVKKHRAKLGISAADYGRLVGVSGLTIYNWEKGGSSPREQPLRRWAQVRQLGKREALRKLDEME